MRGGSSRTAAELQRFQSSPAQLPAAVLGATRGGFGAPSGGGQCPRHRCQAAQHGLGTAGSELVSSFPLRSALTLTAKAPAHPCLLLRFCSSKGFHLTRTRGLKFGIGHCVGAGGCVQFCSVPVIRVTSHTGGGRGTAALDKSSWFMG